MSDDEHDDYDEGDDNEEPEWIFKVKEENEKVLDEWQTKIEDMKQKLHILSKEIDDTISQREKIKLDLQKQLNEKIRQWKMIKR